MSRPIDVRSLYLDKWGEPDREAEFETDRCLIRALKWQSSSRTGGVTLYATVGVSDYPLPGVPDSHRQEYFVGFEPEYDDVASPLAWLGIYAQSAPQPLAAGHTYRAPEPLIEGAGFEGFILLAPQDEFLAPIDLPDGRHVEFLMLVPAFEDELDFAKSHSVDELMEAIETADVPFWDPNRRSTFDRRAGAR